MGRFRWKDYWWEWHHDGKLGGRGWRTFRKQRAFNVIVVVIFILNIIIDFIIMFK